MLRIRVKACLWSKTEEVDFSAYQSPNPRQRSGGRALELRLLFYNTYVTGTTLKINNNILLFNPLPLDIGFSLDFGTQHGHSKPLLPKNIFKVPRPEFISGTLRFVGDMRSAQARGHFGNPQVRRATYRSAQAQGHFGNPQGLPATHSVPLPHEWNRQPSGLHKDFLPTLRFISELSGYFTMTWTLPEPSGSPKTNKVSPHGNPLIHRNGSKTPQSCSLPGDPWVHGDG